MAPKLHEFEYILDIVNLDSNKMMLDNIKGGGAYHHLLEPNLLLKSIIFAEGCETALSIYQALELPILAILSASNMTDYI